MMLILVDGSSYIFRAFHALPELTRPSDGMPVNAVLGFSTMLWRLLQEGAPEPVNATPTHMAVIFDKKGPTFRHQLYPQYKANRGSRPDEITVQFDLCREAARAFGVRSIEHAGVEADDVIATYARLAKADGVPVLIVSSDKDLMQLIGSSVKMFDSMAMKVVDENAVREKWGVPPSLMRDLQALVGDTVDNVPGVPGIGAKTAAELLTRFGDLEGVLFHVDEITQPKRRESLIASRDTLVLSKQLVTLRDDVPVEPLDALAVTERDYVKLIGFCKAMEFANITQRIAAVGGIDADTVPPAQEHAAA